MSQALAIVQAAALVAANPSAPVTWSTKAGKIKRAHSEAAQARANPAANKADKDARTLAALLNNRYVEFMADVREVCNASKAHGAALVSVVTTELARTVDGVVMVPDSAQALNANNKAAALAFARYVAAPWVMKKVGEKGARVDVRTAKPFPKAAQYLTTIAAAWLEALAQAEAMAEADKAAQTEAAEADKAAQAEAMAEAMHAVLAEADDVAKSADFVASLLTEAAPM